MLTLLVLIPVLAAILSGFCKVPARPSALIAVILNLLLGVVILTNGAETCPFLSKFDNALGLKLMSSGISIQVVMLILTLIVSFASVMGANAPKTGETMWYNSTLLIAAGALGAFLSNSLIGFFSFHELALIPTFLMIGIYGRGDKRSIAWRATLYLGFGSLVLLAGLVMLIYQTGCYTFTDLKALFAQAQDITIPFAPVISGLLLAGFGSLISLFPFHSWAAPAYASAPAPIAMMHAGVLKKFGLYGLFMLASILPSGYFSYWLPTLLVLLVGNVLWVGWVTINQKRLDLTLGNSSVMHMGYIFLALAAFIAAGNSPENMNDLALKGGTMLMLGHGLSIALLFLLCGTIERSTGSLEYASLGGLGTRVPKLALYFGMGAMASIGLPGFANFPGEILVFFSGFKGWFDGTAPLGGVQIATICCLAGLIISAVYMLRAYRNIFQGSQTRLVEEAHPMSLQERLAAFILSAALLIIGLYPNLILDLLK